MLTEFYAPKNLTLFFFLKKKTKSTMFTGQEVQRKPTYIKIIAVNLLLHPYILDHSRNSLHILLVIDVKRLTFLFNFSVIFFFLT